VTGLTVVLSAPVTVTNASVSVTFGTEPDNVYACAAPMGVAMGLNTGGPGSYFAMAYKQLTGVSYEPLTQTQIQNICGTNSGTIQGLNCNIVTDYQFGSYTGLWQLGQQASGNYFDQILQLDMLVNDIQTTVFNFFVNSLSVPITNAGATLIQNLIAQCCNRSQQRGFIAQGVWQGATIGTGNSQIAPGDAFPLGYAIYMPSVQTLSLQQIAKRQMPLATVCIIEAGSANYQAISIYVQP
jgi:hypothetical protein